VECVCADIVRDRFYTGLAQVQGPHCPSAPTISGVNMTDSHGPRDINIKSLHEAALLVHVQARRRAPVSFVKPRKVLQPPGWLWFEEVFTEVRLCDPGES